MILGNPGGITDGFVLAEHQQPGDGQSLLAGGTIRSPAAELFEQPLVVEREPGVGRGPGGETIAVLLQAPLVEILDPEAGQDFAVGGLLRLVGQHPTHFIPAAKVIAVAVAPVGSIQRVLTHKDRALPT